MVRGTEMSASGCSKGAKAPAREDPAATASTSATDSATATASSSAMASPSAEASTSAVTSSSASAKATVEKKPSKKPMMEKKRRARMNKSLNELRALISAANSLDAASRHSKLEKADILERTVAHLQELMQREKRGHAAMLPYENRHESGYRECVAQVKEFFEKNSTGGQRVLSKRLIDHLERHLSARTSSSSPHLDLHQDMMEMRDAAASSRNVRLMPTFMPDGQLVLMMPQSQAHMLGSPSTSSSPVLACASSPIPSISMPIMPAHTRRLPLPSSSPYGSPLSRIYTPNRLSPPISNQGNDEPIDLIKKSIWRTW